MNVEQIGRIVSLMREIRKELNEDLDGADSILKKFEDLAEEIEYQGVGVITEASLEGVTHAQITRSLRGPFRGRGV